MLAITLLCALSTPFALWVLPETRGRGLSDDMPTWRPSWGFMQRRKVSAQEIEDVAL